MGSTLQEDWPLAFHCANQLQEVLSPVPIPEAVHDAPPTMLIGSNSDNAEKTSGPQADEHWIACDDCNKWRALPVDTVARSKVGSLVASMC